MIHHKPRALSTTEMSSRPSLLIPVRASDENVEVFTDELPDDADDILAILQAEIAPLDIWLKFAVCYTLYSFTTLSKTCTTSHQ